MANKTLVPTLSLPTLLFPGLSFPALAHRGGPAQQPRPAFSAFAGSCRRWGQGGCGRPDRQIDPSTEPVLRTGLREQ